MGKRLSEKEMITRIKQRCEDRNFEFVSFLDDNPDIIKRKCIIRCKNCGELSYPYFVSRLYDKNLRCQKCKSVIKFTEDEAILNLKNVLSENNLEFIRFDEEYKGSSTKVVFRCKKCGELRTLRYQDIMYHGQKIHTCKDDKIKTSMLRMKNYSKEADVRIIKILTNTDFDFVKFVNDEYIGVDKTKVVVKCKTCGCIFTINYASIVSSSFVGRCKKCNPSSTKKRQISLDDIKRRCLELNLLFISADSESNFTLNTKIITKCLSCGRILEPAELDYVFGVGKKCKYCNNKSIYTKERAEERVYSVCKEQNFVFNGYVDGYFKDTSSKIFIHCNKCNKDFVIKMRELWHGDYHGHKCIDENLYIEKTNERIKKLENEIKNILNGSTLEFISIIQNKLDFRKSHIKVRCKKCGKIITYAKDTILSPSFKMKCKFCGHYSFTEDSAIKIINSLCLKYGLLFDGFNTEDGHYKGKLTKLFLVCKSCGYRWSYTSFEILLQGRKFCPNCEKQIWKMECEIKEMLNENNIQYIHDCRSRNLSWLKNKRSLSLDFYIKDYNIAIECQGEQHFKAVDYFGGEKRFKDSLERDKLKLKLCKENGVSLLYYDSENNHKEFLGENVYNTIDEIFTKMQLLINK